MSRVLDDGVAVIGAGVAGLAAARHLRAHKVPVTLLEAGPRIGGRAWTETIAGGPFDHGASWLHAAERNPLVPLARPDDALTVQEPREDRLTVGGRRATAAEHAAYAALEARLDELTPTGDPSLWDAMAPLHDDPWAGLLAQWEGAIIAAADADRLGFADWRLNRLDGQNLVAADGIGAFVTRRLATEAWLGTPAWHVAWDGPGVRVATPRGTVSAAAAVITVSTGVLAAGGIGFTPALPACLLHAVAALPMGLLSKVVLPAAGPDRLGLSYGTLLEDREGRMTFNAWPAGRGHVVGFVGGRRAWDVADDPAAAEALARQEFARAMGNGAATALGPAARVTDWGTNPLYRGSYAYAGPGASGQRSVLAEAFPGERLLFAGEAARSDGLAGTVGGAFLSGVEAAERLLR